MDRRANGIHPELPPPADREKIRAEFLQTYKKPTIHIHRQ